LNYIWEVAVRAKQQNIDEESIVYKPGREFSAYMELSFEYINESNVLSEIEINPYYRFYKIFKKLLHPDFVKEVNDSSIVEVLHDMSIHHLIDIDLFIGMSRREYYISFIVKDLEAGYMGEFIKNNIYLFDLNEKKILANNLLNLYSSGECIHFFKETVRNIFKNCYIFSNAQEKDEVLIYLRSNETDDNEDRLVVIEKLFMPFKYNVLVYWRNFVGIIDIPELMIIDEMLIY
jgi:hypothetical protein